MSYKNCPFDDVNVVMVKGQQGDIVRPSDPEFQDLVVDYILDNPGVLNTPALESAITNYLETIQTVYTNYGLGQTYTVCERFDTDTYGDNVVILPDDVSNNFTPKRGGILAINFPEQIPEGNLKIRIRENNYPVVRSYHDVTTPYYFEGFEASPGDTITFIFSHVASDDFDDEFVILGTNRPAPGVMPDGRIWNKYLPKPDSLFVTTSGTVLVESYSPGEKIVKNIAGLGPEGVKSYPLFMDVTVNSVYTPSTATRREVMFWNSGITDRSTGTDERGEFSGEVTVVNNASIPPIMVNFTWTVTWYVYG